MRIRARIRRLWMLALLLLGSNMWLGFVFYVAMYAQATARDPHFVEQSTKLEQLYAPDPQEVTEAGLQRYYDAMQPLYAPIDWLQVALVSSTLGFGGLGLFAARMRIEPRWMGALPLATMLSGPNPAVLPTFLESQGLPVRHLALEQQVGVLAVQTVVLFLVAYLTSKPPKSP